MSLKLTKKMKQKALITVLSDKYRENSISVLDRLDFKEPKTKKAASLINKIAAGKRLSRLIVAENNESTLKSFRNLQGVGISLAIDLNPLNVVKSSGLIFTLAGLEKLKTRFGENNDKSN